MERIDFLVIHSSIVKTKFKLMALYEWKFDLLLVLSSSPCLVSFFVHFFCFWNCVTCVLTRSMTPNWRDQTYKSDGPQTYTLISSFELPLSTPYSSERNITDGEKSGDTNHLAYLSLYLKKKTNIIWFRQKKTFYIPSWNEKSNNFVDSSLDS